MGWAEDWSRRTSSTTFWAIHDGTQQHNISIIAQWTNTNLLSSESYERKWGSALVHRCQCIIRQLKVVNHSFSHIYKHFLAMWLTFLYLISSGSSRRLTLHQLLESNFPAINSSSKLSREELLMWERKRQAPSWGISSYELHADTGKLIFPAASNLFQCVDTGFSVSKTSEDYSYFPI